MLKQRFIRVQRKGELTEYAWSAETFPPSIELVEAVRDKLKRVKYVHISTKLNEAIEAEVALYVPVEGRHVSK